MYRIIITVFLSAIAVTACCGQPGRSEERELKEMIAQMLMIGFRGVELTPENHIYTDITELKIGGVILFEYDAPSKSRPRNIVSKGQLSRLVADMQSLAEARLLVAIDQEGGRVNRLKESYGFPPTVSAKYLGRMDNADTTAYWAARTASLLSKVGINVNFVPSVDLNTNPSNPVIGRLERSFSADADVVSRNAAVWIDEHRKYGIISSTKHFPGHGSSDTDSHLGFTDVTNSWTEEELLPYKRLIGQGKCDLVMTSHVFNSKLDSLYPATMSHAVLTGLLRGELGYEGVIVTDDMAMGAITVHYGFEDALEKTINAGADILILSNNGDEYDDNIAARAVEIIYRNVVDGTIPESRIEESYKRIMALKTKYGIGPPLL